MLLQKVLPPDDAQISRQNTGRFMFLWKDPALVDEMLIMNPTGAFCTPGWDGTCTDNRALLPL